MAGGALTLSVGLSASPSPPSPLQPRSYPRSLSAVQPLSSCAEGGQGHGLAGAKGPAGAEDWGGGSPARWRGRGSGRPGKPEGPEARQRSWVGVSRWPWESAGRASNCARSGWHGLVPRRRAAASPQLVQCGGRGEDTPQPGLTPPPPTPPPALGAGDPRRTKEEGALLEQGRKKGGAPCTHNHYSSEQAVADPSGLLRSVPPPSSTPTTPRKTYWLPWARWG